VLPAKSVAVAFMVNVPSSSITNGSLYEAASPAPTVYDISASSFVVMVIVGLVTYQSFIPSSVDGSLEIMTVGAVLSMVNVT